MPLAKNTRSIHRARLCSGPATCNCFRRQQAVRDGAVGFVRGIFAAIEDDRVVRSAADQPLARRMEILRVRIGKRAGPQLDRERLVACPVYRRLVYWRIRRMVWAASRYENGSRHSRPARPSVIIAIVRKGSCLHEREAEYVAKEHNCAEQIVVRGDGVILPAESSPHDRVADGNCELRRIEEGVLDSYVEVRRTSDSP